MLRNKFNHFKLPILAFFCLVILSLKAQSTVNEHVHRASDFSVVGLAFFGMLVVFVALAVLVFFFKGLGHVLNREAKKISSSEKSDKNVQETQGLSGEVSAAIVMALFLYSNEMHDMEDPIITMTKVSRTYSPWSSKIYGLRKSPR